MNRTSRKQTSTKGQVDLYRNRELRTTLRREGVSRGHRGGSFRDHGHVRSVIMGSLMSGVRLLAVTAHERSSTSANVRRKRMGSTETDNLQVMLFGLKPVIKQKSLSRVLLTLLIIVVFDILTQNVEVLCDASVGRNSRNEKYEQVKEEQERYVEEVNVHKMEKYQLEKKLLEKDLAMKATILSQENSERKEIYMKTKKRFS